MSLIKKKIQITCLRENGDIKKSDVLLLTILFAWFLIIIYFNPMLFSLLIGDEPLIAKISVVLFVIVLDMMWLYGIYHSVNIVFAYFIKIKPLGNILSKAEQPAVALLYMTRNDFNPNACLTSVCQKYENFHVYICDDSDNPEIKNKIDLFVKKHEAIVSVFRRSNILGYKAGNINHALSEISRDYHYIAINDADTEIPQDFLSKLMPWFKHSPNIGFVQAKQKSLKQQTGDLGCVMKSMIDIHWKYYMALKNDFGFVMWYGHGAVLKRCVIEVLGGIPEVVTEDLAFSSEARCAGYYGIVVDDVVCGEEFPQTIEKFRKRNKKWVRGTFQYLTKFYPKIFKAKDVPWFEKADIFISAFTLLQAIPFLLLVFAASFIMPFYYNVSQIQGPLFLVPPLFYDNWMQIILKTRYNVFWVFDFYLVMFATIFFPLIPAVIDLWQNKKQLLRYLYTSSFLHLSILLDSAKEIIVYLFTGKTYFPVTNNRSEIKESAYWLLIESLIGWGLIIFAFTSYNLWLLSLGTAFVLTRILGLWGNKKLVRALVPIPFIVTLAIMFFIGITILQNYM
ncbi:MAG: glycosyltransferase [Candidatus Omnitrophica bacterium]|nr:glycosyltransferase [Candidatus Omnitrophota bacterium]